MVQRQHYIFVLTCAALALFISLTWSGIANVRSCTEAGQLEVLPDPFRASDVSDQRFIEQPSVPRSSLVSKGENLRVLAVITGAWSFPRYNTTIRVGYLHQQMQHYAQACELGYDVDVVLSTYAPWNYTGVLDNSQHFCARIGKSIRVTVEEFEFEPLPNGTFGTYGTLAYKHRLIFLRERSNYDLFVSQEDDVAVVPHHFSYFLQWTKFFEGTNFYPGFVWYEGLWKKKSVDGLNLLSSSRLALDVRLRLIYLYRFRGIDFVCSHSAAGYMYMLTQSMLLNSTSQEEWLSAIHTAKGEFNVYFGSARWLQPKYRVAIPVSDIHRSMFHHLPDLYATRSYKIYLRGDPISHEKNYITFGDWIKIIERCATNSTVSQLARVEVADSYPIIISNRDCKKCNMSSGAVSLRIEKPWLPRNTVNVTYNCVPFASIGWPGYRGLDRFLV